MGDISGTTLFFFAMWILATLFNEWRVIVMRKQVSESNLYFEQAMERCKEYRRMLTDAHAYTDTLEELVELRHERYLLERSCLARKVSLN